MADFVETVADVPAKEQEVVEKAAVAGRARSTPAAAKRKKYDPPSRAFFAQQIKLNSMHAQQAFERAFDGYAGAAYGIAVVLRFITTEEQAVEAEKAVNAEMEKFRDALRDESGRLDSIADANGIETSNITYSSPKTVQASITSPQVVSFLALVREFDALVGKFDALWLSGLVSGSEYSRGIFEMKRGLLRLAGRSGTIYRRARDAASRKNVTLTEPGPDAGDEAQVVINGDDALPAGAPTPVKQRRKQPAVVADEQETPAVPTEEMVAVEQPLDAA